MIEYVSVLHSPATRPRYDPHHLTGLKISKYSRISRHPPASCPVPELAEGPWRRPSPVMLGHDLVTHQSAPNGQIWCASATYYRPSARIGRLWCSSDPVFLPSARIGPFWCSSGNIVNSCHFSVRCAPLIGPHCCTLAARGVRFFNRYAKSGLPVILQICPELV